MVESERWADTKPLPLILRVNSSPETSRCTFRSFQSIGDRQIPLYLKNGTIHAHVGVMTARSMAYQRLVLAVIADEQVVGLVADAPIRLIDKGLSAIPKALDYKPEDEIQIIGEFSVFHHIFDVCAHCGGVRKINDFPGFSMLVQEHCATGLHVSEIKSKQTCERCVREREAQKARECGNRRKEREASAPGSHSRQEWRAVVEKYGSKCLRCGKAETTKDHVIPLAGGGSDDIDNLQPLCRRCNSWKQTRIVDFRPDRVGWRHDATSSGDQLQTDARYGMVVSED